MNRSLRVRGRPTGTDLVRRIRRTGRSLRFPGGPAISGALRSGEKDHEDDDQEDGSKADAGTHDILRADGNSR